MEKMPPIEKVYEAWSALADGRVAQTAEGAYQVTSSDRSKTYTVKYVADTDTYFSNDNATLWAGYPGYPVLAVMMMRGSLPCDYEYIQQWADVNWHALNEQHKHDYSAAVASVEADRAINPADASRRATLAMDTLATFQQSQFRPLRGKH